MERGRERHTAGRGLRGDGRLTSSEALRAALEDPGTIEFIRACFSVPEKRPKIFSRTIRFRRNPGHCWRVAVVERPSAAHRGAARVFNLALVDIDADDGTVLGRRFYRGLLAGEIRRALSLGIPRKGCKDRSP